MTTARLVPSIFYNYSGTTYLTVSDADNAYTNTDSDTYATVTNINNATTSRYVYLRGFNFSSVPDDAIVSKIEIKIKASHSGGNTSTIYGYNGTTQVSSVGSTTALETSATVKTFTNTTISWDTLKNYGDNFGIRINCRRSNKSNTAYIYIYGAEIVVTYTVPVYHSISVTGENTSPSGTTSVLEGTSLTVKAYYDEKPTVTDNNVDVTSQLVQATETGASYTVTNITSTYGFALNNNNYYESNNKAHASSAAVCKVDFSLPVASTITFSVINYAESTYDYGLLSNLDTTLNTNASADTSNVYWNGKNNNSSSVQTVTYSNVTAGDHYIYVKYFKDSYTDSNNDSLQFKVAITLNEAYTPRTYWGYTLTNITTDHTIVVAEAITDKFWVKIPMGSETAIVTQGYWDSGTIRMGTVKCSVDLSALIPGTTYHVVGNGYAQYIGVEPDRWVIDTNYEYSSGGAIPYTLTSGQGNTLSSIVADSTGITINFVTANERDAQIQSLIFYLSESGGWTEVSKVYKKISGSWIEQTTPSTALDSGVQYRKGN